MKRYMIRLIVVTIISFILFGIPGISMGSAVVDDINRVIIQTSFESDWHLDEDMDFFAPTSVDDVWDVDGVNSVNSGQNTFWSKIQSTGTNQQYIHSGLAAAGVWPRTGMNNQKNGVANDEWLITPTLDLRSYYDITLSFWSQYHPTFTILMPFFELRGVNNTYLVKISQDNGNTWKTIADLRDEDKYRLGGDINQKDYWNMYDVPIEIPLDYYATGKDNIKIAWHYFYSGKGPAERWIVDDVKIMGKKDDAPPNMKILAPKDDAIYVNNEKFCDFNKLVVVGDYTVKVDPTDEGVGTAYVDFFVDGMFQYRDTNYPYHWDWTESSFGTRKVTITAYDYAGFETTNEFTVLKLF